MYKNDDASLLEVIAVIMTVILIILIELAAVAYFWNKWIVPWANAPHMTYWMVLKIKVICLLFFGSPAVTAKKQEK